MTTNKHAHVIVGAFPPGAHGGHDMDNARMRIEKSLRDNGCQSTTVSPDYASLDQYLKNSKLLVTYTAGPVPDENQTKALKAWLEGGGRWLCLHGSSGGKADKARPGEKFRRMVHMPFHDVLGARFLTHPPNNKFEVRVEKSGGASSQLLKNVPDSFSATDELYHLEMTVDPKSVNVLLTTQVTAAQAKEALFGTVPYDTHPALEGPQGSTLCLGFERKLGKGGVVYIALGHTHSDATCGSTFVHESADPAGKPNGPKNHVATPREWVGVWGTEAFQQLVTNGVNWGLEEGPSSSKL